MNDIETRHSHGTVRHDHEGGDVPHNHWPGDPRLTEQQEKTLSSSGYGASAAFSFGTIFIVFGALAVLWQNSSHSACSSVLVQAVSQSQCTVDSDIWTVGVIGLVVGVVLLIVGAILRSKS